MASFFSIVPNVVFHKCTSSRLIPNRIEYQFSNITKIFLSQSNINIFDVRFNKTTSKNYFISSQYVLNYTGSRWPGMCGAKRSGGHRGGGSGKGKPAPNYLTKIRLPLRTAQTTYRSDKK